MFVPTHYIGTLGCQPRGLDKAGLRAQLLDHLIEAIANRLQQLVGIMLDEVRFGVQGFDRMLAVGDDISFDIKHHGTTGVATLIDREEKTVIAVHVPSSWLSLLVIYRRCLFELESGNVALSVDDKFAKLSQVSGQ